ANVPVWEAYVSGVNVVPGDGEKPLYPDRNFNPRRATDHTPGEGRMQYRCRSGRVRNGTILRSVASRTVRCRDPGCRMVVGNPGARTATERPPAAEQRPAVSVPLQKFRVENELQLARAGWRRARLDGRVAVFRIAILRINDELQLAVLV